MGSERRAESMRINVDVSDFSPERLYEELGKVWGKKIVLGPEVLERVYVNDLEHMSWQEGSELLSRMLRCRVVERSDGSLLFTRKK